MAGKKEPSWHQNGIKNRCLLGRAIFQNSCSGCSAGGPQRIPHRTVRWGTSLGLDCKNGIQVGMHLGIDFSSILMVFGRQVGTQNGPKVDPKKHGKKHAKKDQFFNALGGGVPRTRHLRAGIVRPPKTPNTTGTGQVLGLGQWQRFRHGQAQAHGQGQGHRASGQDHPLTPSRKARWRIRF